MRADQFTMNGTLLQSQGASIASAATINLATATGNSLTITGSTGPVTSLGTVAAGAVFTLTFASTPTLTHNATSLILPTGANIVVAAADVAEFTSLGSGNWKCTNYLRASGEALAGGGSGVASVSGNIVDNTDPVNPVVTSPYTKDADGNVFYDGVTATLGTGCTLNTFEQGATGNVLGNDCTLNTFQQASVNNTLGASCAANIFEIGAQTNELGATCSYNTFGQGARDFILGDNFAYTTIVPGTIGDDYTATPDYDFLYNNSYPSQIFYDATAGANFHSYVDAATRRIVLTNLTTLAVSYIGGDAIINILREDFISLAGTYSTASLYRITDATPGAILLDPSANNANSPDFTFSAVTNETALVQGTYYLGTTGNADDVFFAAPNLRIVRMEITDAEIAAGTALNIVELPEVVDHFWNITEANISYTGTTPYTNIMYVGIISMDPQFDDAGRLVVGTNSFGGMRDLRSDTAGGNGNCFAAGRCQVTFDSAGGAGDGTAVLYLAAQLVSIN